MGDHKPFWHLSHIAETQYRANSTTRKEILEDFRKELAEYLDQEEERVLTPTSGDITIFYLMYGIQFTVWNMTDEPNKFGNQTSRISVYLDVHYFGHAEDIANDIFSTWSLAFIDHTRAAVIARKTYEKYLNQYCEEFATKKSARK